MKEILFCLLALTIIAPAGGADVQPLPFRESFALIIGIDRYPSPAWKDLHHAVQDAGSMVVYLKRQGFQVQVLYNEGATKEAILKAFRELAVRLSGEDRVLVFFAGHGHTEILGKKQWGYIVPYDGTGKSATYISMEELRTESVRMREVRHQLFIMDTCFGGMLGDSRGTELIGALDPRTPYYIRELSRRRARLVLTAGGRDQRVADGGPGGHSLFTSALLRALEEGEADSLPDGYITFSELANYLVPAATNRFQTPTVDRLAEHEGGEFLFRSPKPVAPGIQPASSHGGWATGDPVDARIEMSSGRSVCGFGF